MKWLGITVLACTVTVLLSLGLFELFNPDITVSSDTSPPKVTFTSTVFDNHQKDAIEAEIMGLLKAPQICSTNDDCLQSRFGCPFGCSSLTNAINHEHIQSLKIPYNMAGGTYCRYRCSAPAEAMTAACIDNICALVKSIDGQDNIRNFLDNHKKSR